MENKIVKHKQQTVLLYAFFLSGAAALIYEVAWIRPITTILHSTIYVISIILASFMFGLAIGSFIAGKILNTSKNPLYVYAFIEIIIGISAMVVLFSFKLLPVTFESLLKISSPVKYFFTQFFSVFLILIIPTSLMGATFPVLSKAYVQSKALIGKGIGKVYGANNAGAILGSLIAGFFLVPKFGIKYSIIIGAIINLFVGIGIIALYYPTKMKKMLIIFAPLFIFLFFIVDYNMVYIFKSGKDYIGGRQILFYEEGMYGTVVVSDDLPDRNIKRLFINGHGSSSLRFNDVRVSLLLGVLPGIYFPEGGRALSIGFGPGSTSNVLNERFTTTTVEIEQAVVKTAKYFQSINNRVDLNKKHELIFDDARHYLMKTDEKFDVIVNHPLDPHQSFSSLLFTKDFYDIVAQRLAPGGVFVQWFPTYSLSTKDRKCFYYTLKSVFPYINAYYAFRKGEKITEKDSYTKKLNTITFDANSRELILLCSFKKHITSEETIKNGFKNLNSNIRELLAKVHLNNSTQMSQLFLQSDNKPYQSNDNIQLNTDDYPILEFTTPIEKIKTKN